MVGSSETKHTAKQNQTKDLACFHASSVAELQDCKSIERHQGKAHCSAQGGNTHLFGMAVNSRLYREPQLASTHTHTQAENGTQTSRNPTCEAAASVMLE